MNKKNKTAVNVLITLLCILSINYYIFSKNELGSILAHFKHMELKWVIFAAICLIIYIITDILITFLITKKFYKDVSLNLAVKTVLGLYVFNNITPFFTGGFPYQVYLYTKRGIPISKTSTITITRNILYQAVLIIYSLPALLFVPEHNKKYIIIIITINITIHVIGIIMQMTAMYKPVWLKNTGYFVIRIFNKIKLIKQVEKLKRKVDKHVANFYKCNVDIKNNSGFIIPFIILQIISFLFLFSVGFFVFKGFKINANYMSMIFMISCIYLFGFIIPTPGGTGGIEGSFYLLFVHISKNNNIIPIMLVWRFLTYYLLMITGSLSFLIKNKK